MTLGLPLSTMYAFLFVLARVGGLFAFLPLPGLRAAPDIARAMLAMMTTIALFPVWPQLPNELLTISQLVVAVLVESGFGLMAGVAVAFLTEGLQMAAQIFGLQAGYSYSTTIDPTSQADAGILQVMISLAGGLLFVTTGTHRELLRILAASLERFPAGTWHVTAAAGDSVIRLGSSMISLGLRLALPVVAILLLIDLSLALLGRMQQQLQLLSLAFPIKMLAALAILIVLAPMVPSLYNAAAARMIATLTRTLAP
jgi:flagellar biosynthesis protein FliR